jgi:hypothetical protein
MLEQWCRTLLACGRHFFFLYDARHQFVALAFTPASPQNSIPLPLQRAACPRGNGAGRVGYEVCATSYEKPFE